MMKMKLILFLFALLFALLGFASLVSGQGNEHSYSLPFNAHRRSCSTLPVAVRDPGFNCVDAGGMYVGDITCIR